MKFTTSILLLGLIFLQLSEAKAQQQKLLSSFQKDSIFIGEEVKYCLSYYHPSDLQIIFPDSNYNFYPFELVRKRPFNTISNNSWSLDSVVYYLRTFQVINQHALALPIVILNKDGDSTIVYSNSAKVNLKLITKENTINAQLLPDVELTNLQTRFNYPYFLVFGLGSVFLVVFVLYLFRKTIIKRYRLYTLRNSHVSFVKLFDRLEKSILTSKDLFELEKLVGEWKKYLSKLEEVPINTYTTTEIIAIFQNEELGNTLQYLDRCIYGNNAEIDIQKSTQILKRFTFQRFQKKKKEAKTNL